jgi:hypothetical protein
MATDELRRLRRWVPDILPRLILLISFSFFLLIRESIDASDAMLKTETLWMT